MHHIEDETNLSNRLKFYSVIRSAAQQLPHLDYSIITGGFIHTDTRINDVDIISVVSIITNETRNAVLRFAIQHVRTEDKFGYIPDLSFPTDVMTRQQVIDAVNGRALTLRDRKLVLKEYSEEELVSNPESDYRVWLFEMISHDFDIIEGSFHLLVHDTITALKTVFLLACDTMSYSTSVSLLVLRSDMFKLAAKEYLLPERQLRLLLSMIEHEGFGRLVGGELYLVHNRIDLAIEHLKQIVTLQVFSSGAHIVSWFDLREYVRVHRSEVM